MSKHVLKSYDQPDDTSEVEMILTLAADAIRVEESPYDERGVVIEQTGGTIKVRIYSADKQEPVTITLPEAGGLEIDNFDHQREATA